MRPYSAVRWYIIATAFVGLLTLAGLGVYVAYARDMQRITQHVALGSKLAQTRHGPIEYASWGSGPAVLVVHGAGGGYDQGRLLPQAFGGGGFTWISVSRFGYLRSAMPEVASTEAQAEAFADLLVALKIDRVAILAMSGGGTARLAVRRTLSTTHYCPCLVVQRALHAPDCRTTGFADPSLGVPAAVQHRFRVLDDRHHLSLKP